MPITFVHHTEALAVLFTLARTHPVYRPVPVPCHPHRRTARLPNRALRKKRYTGGLEHCCVRTARGQPAPPPVAAATYQRGLQLHPTDGGLTSGLVVALAAFDVDRAEQYLACHPPSPPLGSFKGGPKTTHTHTTTHYRSSLTTAHHSPPLITHHPAFNTSALSPQRGRRTRRDTKDVPGARRNVVTPYGPRP